MVILNQFFPSFRAFFHHVISIQSDWTNLYLSLPPVSALFFLNFVVVEPLYSLKSIQYQTHLTLFLPMGNFTPQLHFFKFLYKCYGSEFFWLFVYIY